MIIDPRIMVDSKSVFPVNLEDIQPNSIDLKVKEIHELVGSGCGLYKASKVLPSLQKAPCENHVFKLKKGNCYDVVFEEFVRVPQDRVGFIICKSTLNRLGGFITSGLYDSGFENYVGAMLRLDNDIEIERGVRIATMFFVEAKASRKYSGQYQGDGSLDKWDLE